MQPTPNKLTIPGRPQARSLSGGRRLHGAHYYLQDIRYAARSLTRPNGDPQHPTGSVHVDLLLVYTSEDDLEPSTWHAASIPNADSAASLVLQGLTGALYAHASQANPLVVTRRVIRPIESIDRYGPGATHGATVITWGEA